MTEFTDPLCVVDSAVQVLVQDLRDRGWTSRRFSANHLRYAVNDLAEDERSATERDFIRYWRTVGRISRTLDGHGITHVIIKTRRNYRYADTNVDVYVEDGDWPSVHAALSGDQWRMPSKAVRLKQRLIERAKIKLPSRSEDLVPAHVYYAVSWRYQRDVTFLSPRMIEQVPIITEAPELWPEFGDLSVPMPTRAADLLIHPAEIVFENYRITLGEVLYLRWLLGSVPSLERKKVYRLGVERGAAGALRCALSHVRPFLHDPSAVTSFDWPRELNTRGMLLAWRDRLRRQAGNGRPIAGLEEFLGYGAWAGMYRVKRALWR